MMPAEKPADDRKPDYDRFSWQPGDEVVIERPRPDAPKSIPGGRARSRRKPSSQE